MTIGSNATDFKRNLRSSIAPYFNGATHIISNVSIAFPQINNILFHDPLLDTPTNIGIHFVSRGVGEFEKLKCHHPALPNGQVHGYEKRLNVIQDVFVVAPREAGSPTGTPEFVHKVWDCLTALLNSNVTEFANKSIFQIKIEDIPIFISNSKVNGLNIVVGNMTCQFRYKFGTFSV